MQYTNQLRDILAHQKNQIEALEQSITDIEAADLTTENERLRGTTETLIRENERLLGENIKLSEENKQLRSTLTEQLLNERLSIIHRSREQLTFYFGRSETGIQDRLTALEERYMALLDDLKESVSRDAAKTEADLQARFKDTSDYTRLTVQAIRELNRKKLDALDESFHTELEQVAAEPLPPGVLESRLKRFNLEMRFGTKILNILGVALVLLGVVFGLQYSYVNLLRSNELKSAAAYMLGLLFLIGGELLQRRHLKTKKQANHFAIGVTSGGIAILYASTAISYFNLQILPMYPAIGLCVGVSLIAFLLSVRYNARTVACFALIGGYLPLTAVTGGAFMVHSALLYITLLSLFSLMLATQKKWPVINGVSLFLYMLGSLYLLFVFRSDVADMAGVSYILINFVMYLAVVLVYPILNATRKKPGVSESMPVSMLTQGDMLVLSANTLLSCLYLYGFLNTGPLRMFAYNGALAIVFFIFYFAGARLLTRLLPAEKPVRALFHLTSLTFAILIVPLQFGMDWLLIGWLAEGVLLLVYGALRDEKWFERAGWAVTAMAVLCFLPKVGGRWIHLYGFSPSNNFFIDYTLLTIGLIVVAVIYRYLSHKNSAFDFSQKGKLVLIFRYVVVISTGVYCLYAAFFIYGKIVRPDAPADWRNMLLIMTGLAYTVGIKYIPYLRDRVITIVSILLRLPFSTAVVMLNRISVKTNPYHTASLGLLIAFNLLAVIMIYDCIRTLRTLLKPGLEWLSMVTSLYAMILITQTLMVQYAYSPNSILLSTVGMLASLLWILFGFIWRNRFMRLFGLGFSIFSTSKLFLMDLWFLESAMRIASYFMFGVVLIGISFVYQHFSRKLLESGNPARKELVKEAATAIGQTETITETALESEGKDTEARKH